MRYLKLVFFVLLFENNAAQQLLNPDSFLGYSLGSKFTPHHKVVDYFSEIAKKNPEKVHLINYGFTNENKPLILAVVSTVENMSKIEEIRKNNLRLAGLINDKPAVVDLPSLVWLSYNVHGNEASSTEVAIKLLYELTSGKNDQLNEWLKNTVVMIDPCLNPDGRDRYVNWYNQNVGKSYDANPLSREHSEPWPGGRLNHYYFDLNRDWAWQTQIESVQRMKIYNDWMPQIHCDFHEQYPNNPYYFAPAAEPFHEIISPWQRSFQDTIGRNHAKYFDANGWLYFTKEVFDLFYPSYGDTYPLFNGSIGMTYEQAGHSRGGLAIQVNDDTLTLHDRILHHYTTSISTIESASKHHTQLNGSFKKYFDDGRMNGAGFYKSYVIKSSHRNQMMPFIDLLKKNKIEFYYAKQGINVKGYRYLTNKDESYTTNDQDLIVSTFQSKGALVKALFEPQTMLSDSLTYDITAWALPYAFGLDCFATKEVIKVQTQEPEQLADKIDHNQYAYLINYHSFTEGKLLATMLKYNIKVRFAEKDFSFAGKKYSKGTLVVLRNENLNKMNLFFNFVDSFHAEISSVSSGYMESGFDFGSEKLHLIKKPRVALIMGENVSANASGEIWHLFDQQLDYPITLINSNELLSDNLKDIDVIILSDGEYKFLADKESNIKTWVRQGGKLITMEGALTQLSLGDWGIKLKSNADNTEPKLPSYNDIKRYEERERKSIENNIPGAIYRIGLDDSHPLSFGYTDFYYSLKLNGSVLDYVKEGWNVGVIKQDNLVAGFVGHEMKSKIVDGSVIAVHDLGAGSVICFTDDPIFRSFWENGKLLLCNAVFLVGQ